MALKHEFILNQNLNKNHDGNYSEKSILALFSLPNQGDTANFSDALNKYVANDSVFMELILALLFAELPDYRNNE